MKTNIISKLKNNILEKLNIVSSWSNLHRLSNLPFIKQTYIFIVTIPILASLINKSKITSFSFIDEDFLLKLSILYFIALSFLIARVIVVIWCPEIISEDKNYSNFKKQGYDRLKLLEYIKTLDTHTQQTIKSDIEIANTDNLLSIVFSKVYNHFLLVNTVSRYFAIIFFAIGFLGFIYFLIIQTTIVSNLFH